MHFFIRGEINMNLTVRETELTNEINFTSEASLKCNIKQISLKCQKQIEHFSFNLEDFHFYMSNYLLPVIAKDPLYWYTNPLLKVIKEHIGNELPMCFLLEIKKYETTPIFQNKIEEKKNRYASILLNNTDINEEQQKNY